MGTLVVSALIPNYRRILLDPTPGVTWLDADFLRFVNQAERAICAIKHEAFTVVGNIPMAAGTHQVLPTGGLAIFDLYENTNGGRRATMVPRSLRDANNRFWPVATPEPNVQEWTADPRDPTRFDVSPPNDGTGIVVGLYGAIPTAIAAVGNAINLADSYEMAIQSFVLAKAYAENTVRQDLTKAGYYEGDWKAMVGASSQSQVNAAPKSAQPGGV